MSAIPLCNKEQKEGREAALPCAGAWRHEAGAIPWKWIPHLNRAKKPLGNVRHGQ